MGRYGVFKNFFRNFGTVYIVGIFMLMLINGLFLAMPKLIGLAIDSFNYGKKGLTEYIALITAIGISVSVLKFFSRRYLLGSIRHMEYDIREQIFNHALAIPISYYEKNGPGKVMALITNDVTSLRVALGLGIMILVDVIFFGFFSFFIIAENISLKMAATMLFPMPFLLCVTIYLGRKMRAAQRSAQSSYSDITEFSQELFLGMDIIRAFNKESKSMLRFEEVNRENYERNMRVAFLDSLLAPLTFVLPFLCYAINIYVSGQLILEGSISIGDFVALNGYLILLIGPLMGLGALVAVMQKGSASLDRIDAFLQEEIEGEEPSEECLELKDIVIRNLSFAYEDAKIEALHEINMDIPAGSFVGMVGAPGTGKSTLFKLLLRLYEVPEKAIFFGEEDIRYIPLDKLRRSISYVSPTAYILGATIAENIAFGELGKNRITVEEAAKRAALSEDLGLKVRTETQKVKEGGTDLSGGQKQRINMARGFFKNAPYLLMDDSLSALDFSSASEVLAHLRKGRKQTVIFISQRVEALKEADCIYVFKDNTIVEQGTHEELLAKREEYYRLYAQQFQGGDEHE